MGTPVPSTNNGSSNSVNYMINQIKTGSLVANEPVGQTKRKRGVGATSDIPAPKVKRNNSDIMNYSNDSDSESVNNSISSSENLNIQPNVDPNSKNIKNKFQPPIVISLNDNFTFADIHAKTKLIDNNIVYKYNGKQITLLITNQNTYEEVIIVLKIEGIKFHTYTRKSDIKPKVILKGLPPLFNTDEIKTELAAFNIAIENIKLLRNKNNTNSRQATYLVTVNNNNNLIEIIKIKQLFNVIICWEKFKKSSKSTQCYNCQRYGHGQTNCHHDAKCMRCAGNHPTKVCIIEDIPSNYKCINCGNSHKSNDLNCPVYIKYIQNNKIKTSPNTVNSDIDKTNSHNTDNNNLELNGRTQTYAAVTRSQQHNITPTRESSNVKNCTNCNPAPGQHHYNCKTKSVVNSAANNTHNSNQKSAIELFEVISNCQSELLTQITDLIKLFKTLILDRSASLNFDKVLNNIVIDEPSNKEKNSPKILCNNKIEISNNNIDCEAHVAADETTLPAPILCTTLDRKRKILIDSKKNTNNVSKLSTLNKNSKSNNINTKKNGKS